MNLIQQIEEIQFIENLNIRAFLKKTGFSKVLYYSIKNGEKTTLKPTQKKTLSDCFPKYNFTWSDSQTAKNGDVKVLPIHKEPQSSLEDVIVDRVLKKLNLESLEDLYQLNDVQMEILERLEELENESKAKKVN